MIDWTDRSIDVLERWEAAVAQNFIVPIPDTYHENGKPFMTGCARECTEYEKRRLMADLATMVDRASEIAARQYESPAGFRRWIMRHAIDESGARLFPDPKE